MLLRPFLQLQGEHDRANRRGEAHEERAYRAVGTSATFRQSLVRKDRAENLFERHAQGASPAGRITSLLFAPALLRGEDFGFQERRVEI